MMRRVWMAAVATVVAMSVGCGAPAPTPPPGESVRSSRQRELTAAPGPDVAAAATSNTEFAFDLYRQAVADSTDNAFLSPYSISTALAMTYAGSAGTTQAAFEKVLHISLAEPAFHRAMNDTDRQLASRGQGAKSADGKAFRLTAANQLFAQKGFPIETPFLDTLAVEYGSDVRLMDFVTAAEPARKAINQWVEGNTENRIQELLKAGDVDSATAAVLVNAIYFNAAWATAFVPGNTSSKPFTLLTGAQTSVPTMHGTVGGRTGTHDGVEMAELPYDGRELSMLILAPPAGQLAALEQKLSASWLAGALGELKGGDLDIELPSFEVKRSLRLKQALTALGLGVAFTDAADFSRLSPQGVALDEVVHQAFVKVNEAGTEAAAATAVIAKTTSLPAVYPVKVDRPFLFLIRDHATGAVVFLGRVTSP